MKCGSLFSGIGGLDLAVCSHFGAELAWVSEIEPGPIKVLERHLPVPNLGDITKVDWSDVEPIDIICGGFPCQDISGAGRGEGIREGNRSGLWYEYARAIRHLRPRYVVVENVSALLARGIDIVLGDLAEAGYDAIWTSLRASDVGAPHRRERIFLVAHPSESGTGLEERRSGGQGRQLPESRESAVLRSPLGAGSPEGATAGRGDVQDAHLDARVNGLRERRQDPGGSDSATDPASPRRNGRDASTGVQRLQPAEGDREAVADSHGRRREQRESGERGISESHESRPADAWGLYEPAIRRWEGVVMRPAPESLIEGKLAPEFVEWMMGFPAGWVEGLARTPALKALGNAVVPQQAARALQMLEVT